MIKLYFSKSIIIKVIAILTIAATNFSYANQGDNHGVVVVTLVAWLGLIGLVLGSWNSRKYQYNYGYDHSIGRHRINMSFAFEK